MRVGERWRCGERGSCVTNAIYIHEINGDNLHVAYEDGAHAPVFGWTTEAWTIPETELRGPSPHKQINDLIAEHERQATGEGSFAYYTGKHLRDNPHTGRRYMRQWLDGWRWGAQTAMGTEAALILFAKESSAMIKENMP
jgi:hypothetical protein